MNKFNIHWQVVRVNARNIKDISSKIKYVEDFLLKNPNIYNYDRVLNWAKMTKLGYPKGSEARKFFDTFIDMLSFYKNKFNDPNDIDNDMKYVPFSDLLMVYNDLKNRKYGFQYKNVPKGHIDFMIKLEKELNRDY